VGGTGHEHGGSIHTGTSLAWEDIGGGGGRFGVLDNSCAQHDPRRHKAPPTPHASTQCATGRVHTTPYLTVSKLARVWLNLSVCETHKLSVFDTHSHVHHMLATPVCCMLTHTCTLCHPSPGC
jgi:hypothetical protein